MRRVCSLGIWLLLILCCPIFAQTQTTGKNNHDKENPSPVQINISGLDETLDAKVKLVLKNRLQSVPTPYTDDSIQKFYQNATAYIQTALKPYGYFEPHIRPNYARIGSRWILTFNISPGIPVIVVDVDVKIAGEGATDSAFIKLVPELPIKKEEVLNVENYQSAKDALFNLAANRGYFDAKLTRSQIIINLAQHQATIVLYFDTGMRYHFGETLFPPSDLKLSLLQRFLTYKPGDFYNSNKIQSTQQGLASSGYFQQSVVTPMTTDAMGTEIPVKVELTPVKPRRYTLGAGYGTDTGPRGTLGFNWIPINSYGHHINILARGAYLSAGNTTRQNNTLNASYIIPGKNPATDSYALTAGYGTINQDTGDATSFKTGVSYSTVFWENWQEILALTYLNERYSFTDLPFTNATVLYPSGHWQYVKNRNIQLQKIVTQGITATFDVAGASHEVASKESFLQGKAAIKTLYTFEPTSTRLLARGQLGRTVINDLDNLPLTLQLFAGGPASIRGYKFNSIGPGRNLMVASGEIQQKIYGNWYLAFFCDTGNVGDDDFLATLNTGLGGGVAYLTPIGAAELAVARPVFNGTQKTWQLEFSVGSEL